MDIKQWLEFADKYIMTKQEARDYLEMSEIAFKQSIRTGRLTPIFERGEGRSMVRLFYRKDVEEYKKTGGRTKKKIEKKIKKCFISKRVCIILFIEGDQKGRGWII